MEFRKTGGGGGGGGACKQNELKGVVFPISMHPPVTFLDALRSPLVNLYPAGRTGSNQFIASSKITLSFRSPHLPRMFFAFGGRFPHLPSRYSPLFPPFSRELIWISFDRVGLELARE